jgi:predicted nucleotidyltransferase component of viral defense system
LALHDTYRQQVALLVRVLPFVATEPDFALKGGTAINLFIRDLPRLSVDIDLTYLPVADRPASLDAIESAMLRIADEITAGIKGSKITPSRLQPEGKVTKLVVRYERVQIKIEVTPVLRGTVYAPEMRTVSPRVESAFGFAEIQVTSFADLYAGKIVAALDRQHPRDLFDVRDLLAQEGIDDALRSAFLIYVLSHPRPIAELLAPTRRTLDDEYERGFAGMTEETVPLETLLETREAMIAAMVSGMPESHRAFLLGFKRGNPDWAVLGLEEAAKLPAVQWKLHNLDQLPGDKRAVLADRLRRILYPE